jgi:hypothetical protein
MKNRTLCSIVLLISFFLPWVDFTFFSFSGFGIPSSLNRLAMIGSMWNKTDYSQLNWGYSLYLIPIFAILSTCSDLMNIKQLKLFRNSDFKISIILITCLVIYYGSSYDNLFSVLSFGIYLSFLISFIGLLVKETVFPYNFGQPNYTAQMFQLHELHEKDIISNEEYELEKSRIMEKMKSI